MYIIYINKMDSSNSKHIIQITIEDVNDGKSKSNDGSINESYKRHVFESNKMMSIEKINKYVIRYLGKLYNDLHLIKNKTIEFNFCTKNYGRFGITPWVQLDQSLTEEEWKKDVSKIDINKTLSLYEDEEKAFEEDIERDKFWLNFRFRERIGYGSGENIGFCFFDALIKANIINIKKNRKFENNEFIFKYDESIKEAHDDVIDHIKKLNKFKKAENKIYTDDKGGVDFKDIPELEKFFKCNIIINSNNQYKVKYPGCGKFNKTVYLTFDDEKGHYELDENYKPQFDFYDKNHLYNKEKLGILVKDKNLYYDGKNIYENPDVEEIKKLYKNKHVITIDKLKKNYKPETNIKILYNLYKKDCEELEKYKIRVLNSYSLQKAILQSLYLDLRFLNIKTERVNDYAEYEILNYRKQGGYNHVHEFDKVFKNVYSYDVKSSYPSVLVHPDFKIPIRKGEFKYIEPEKFKKFIEIKKDKNGLDKLNLQYGLFKCKISKSEKSDKFEVSPLPKKEASLGFDYVKFDEFIKSDHDVYTHFDILLAKKLGYDVELLNENIYPYTINGNNTPFNCFLYSADKLIESNVIFSKIVKKFYDAKQKCKGNSVIKTLSSGIWGNLCEDKTYKTKKVKKVNNSFNLNMKDNEHVDYILPNIKDEDNVIDCKYRENDNLTRTSLFRMKPFLLSFQRYLMYIDFIKKIEDAGGKILKIKTDGVYTDKKIDEFEKVKEVYIDGDIVRDKYFDIILFKNKTFYLTTQEDIDEYLKTKKK